MIIGDKPGNEEIKQGRVFVGKTGGELVRRLHEVGLAETEVFLTNLLRQLPQKPGRITAEEIKRDGPQLVEEIQIVKPRVIISLGATVLNWLLGNEADLDARHGLPVQIETCGVKVILFPMFHIAAGFHNPKIEPLIEGDWEAFKKFLRQPYTVNRRDILSGLEEYREAQESDIERLAESDCPIAVDTEGFPGKPWGLSFCGWPGHAYVILAHQKACLSKLAKLVKNRLVILHNSLYDMPILEEMGIKVNRFVDTMLYAFLLQTEPQGLKSLAARYEAMHMNDYSTLVSGPQEAAIRKYLTEAQERLDHPVLKKLLKSRARQSLLERWNKTATGELKRLVEKVMGAPPQVGLDAIPRHQAICYSARDADATLRIYHHLKEAIEKHGLERAAAIDMAIIPMVSRMQQVGILLDRNRLKSLEQKMDNEMQQLRSELVRITKDENFNPASPDQVARHLYSRFNIQPKKKTKSGKRPAVDAETLEAIKLEHSANVEVVQFINILQEFTACKVLKNNFITNIGRYMTKDGRIHPTLRLTRAVTGRLAATSPNLLGIPVRSQLGREIRACFVAPPGKLLGSWDLDQVEMRVLAHLSGSKRLIEVLSDPTRHIHKETTSAIYNIPPDKVDKSSFEYMMAKNISFGIIYGLSAAGLQAQLAQRGVSKPLPECQRMIDAWLDTYQGVRKFRNKLIEEARVTGKIRSWAGRIRYLPGCRSADRTLRSEAERQAINFPVQAGAAEVVKLWMAHVWRKVKGLADPLLQIHDELIFQFDEGMEETIDLLIRAALEEVEAELKFRVPLKCSGAWGRSWGELK